MHKYMGTCSSCEKEYETYEIRKLSQHFDDYCDYCDKDICRWCEEDHYDCEENFQKAFVWKGDLDKLIKWCRDFGDNVDYFFFKNEGSDDLIFHANKFPLKSVVIRIDKEHYVVKEPIE